MKITLNELRNMVKSLLKEEFNFDKLKEFEMESKIITMIKDYKDTLQKALSSDDIEFKDFLEDKISILDKMLRLITSGERFTKDFYDDRNEKYQIKKSIKEFFSTEGAKEDKKELFENLIIIMGSRHSEDIKSIVNNIEKGDSFENVYNSLKKFLDNPSYYL
jgi:hypothetical protein